MENVVINYVKSLVLEIPEKDYEGRKLVLDKIEVTNPTIKDIGKLQRLGLTYASTIIFHFTSYTDEGEVKEIFQDSLSVPTLINNSFIINGSIRVSEVSLTSDPSIRVYEKGIRIRKGFSIDYVRENPKNNNSAIIGGIVKYYEPSTNNTIAIPIDEVQDGDERFKFTKREISKLQIKFDVDKKPEYLTKELFWVMSKHPSDKKEDNIIDKVITNSQFDLNSYLNIRNFKREILGKITKSFYKYSKFSLVPIQSRLDYYFNGNQFSSIRYAPQTNPLALDSMIGKIRFDNNTIYNETFMDLIDPINTPENNNVNSINELNVCADLSSGEIEITCIDFRTSKKVKVNYLDYLNSKVLISDYYDYELGEPIESDKYQLKYHQKITEVKSLPSDLKYVEPSHDDRLSLTTRQIPMINYSEPTRIRMGTAMSKQAVEIKGHEPRLVSTGNEDDDYQRYSMTQLFLDTEGIVESIVDKVVTIKDKDGVQHEYTIPETIYGLNGANTSYTTKLKIGDKIKPKQEIITATIQQNHQYEFGSNAFLIYMVYFGYEYEDAYIVSRSFSDKMTYYTIEDITVQITEDDIIDYIIPLGSEVRSMNSDGTNIKSPDRLIGRASRISEKQRSAYNSKITPTKLKEVTHYPNDVLTPNNYRKGWVLDVKFLKSGKSNKYAQHTSTDEVIKNYLGYSLGFGELSKTPKVNYSDEIPKEQLNSSIQDVKLLDEDDKYCIVIRLLKKNSLEQGGKITNSWGSKGMVSRVLPDEEMPYVGTKGKPDYKPAEVLINPNSVTARMNYSQLYECLLASCINKTYDIVVDLFNNGKGAEATEMIKKYYPKTFKDITPDDLHELLLRKGVHALNYKVKTLSKLDFKKLKQWADEVGVNELQRVTIPDVGVIETPQVCGYSYIMRLYHAADASAKVTGSVRRSGQPLLGFGHHRSDGQRWGEMEYWAAQGKDIYEFISKTNQEFLLNQYVYLNQLLLAGFVVTDSFGNPLLSDKYKQTRQLRDMLNKEIQEKLEEIKNKE